MEFLGAAPLPTQHTPKLEQYMKPNPFIFTGLLVAALAACGSVAALGAPTSSEPVGAVYAMTNALGKNQVLVYARTSTGTLTLVQTIDTGGGGSGTQLDPTDSLGSQGGLILDQYHTHLFAVNTETLQVDPVGANGGAGFHDSKKGTISSFLVAPDGRLTLAGRVSSHGLFPNSLTVWGNELYVLNAGGPGISPATGIGPNITGFRFGLDGRLQEIADSTKSINPGIGSALDGFPTDQFLAGQNPPAFPRSPSQVGFTPDGSALVVTVKATNQIYVFPLDRDFGLPGTPAIWTTGGLKQPAYFGFAFDWMGRLIVAEPFGASATIPSPTAGTVSSFTINRWQGNLHRISKSVANAQGTPCWISVDPVTGHYAYVSNNGTSTVSSYTIGEDGSLTLLNATAATDDRGNDMAVAENRGYATDQTANSAFLYALSAASGTVNAWKINPDGSLTVLGSFAGLPVMAGAQGLAAY
jgi:6-phosphogluconolactonase